MAGLKELVKEMRNDIEIITMDDVREYIKEGYSKKDAENSIQLFSSLDIELELNQLKLAVEKSVLIALKGSTDRFVTIGSPECPSVVLDTLTKEYRVLLGYTEERRAYHEVLANHGFHYSAKLSVAKTDLLIAVHNKGFDTSLELGSR